MKGYLEASHFPLIDVGGVPIPRLIMGHLPFVGESYQGKEKNREYLDRFSRVENIVEVLVRAVEDHGVTVMSTMSTSPGTHTERLLEAVSITMSVTGTEITLLPCFQIPLTINGASVDDYRRWVTYFFKEREIDQKEVYRKYITDPILLCREGWKENFPKALRVLQPYSESEISLLQIDYEGLDEAISSLKRFKVILAEPGSESDFLTMTGRTDLLAEFTEWLNNRLNCPILIGTHHAGMTIPILEESKMDIAGYVTPVNRLGVMMFPTRKIAFEAICRCKRKIIAIKPLAGGRIPPDYAFKYVYRETPSVACMVGISSAREVHEDVSAVKKTLSGGK